MSTKNDPNNRGKVDAILCPECSKQMRFTKFISSTKPSGTYIACECGFREKYDKGKKQYRRYKK